MKKKQLFGLAAALLVLAVIYAVLVSSNKKAEEREQAREESQIVSVTDLEEITSFSYKAPEQETLHFEKKDDDWICTEDPKIELEQTYPNGIVNTFASLTASRKLESIDALEDYGLKEPVYTVSLKPEDGKETVLQIGNSTGEEYYLQVKGDDSVIYTVDASAVGTLDHSLEDMEKVEDEENESE